MQIAILGAGESGVGAAVLAKKNNFNVFVSDNGQIKQEYKNVLLQHDIKFEEGRHSNNLILDADEVIKSPGIPDNSAVIQEIRKKGIPVISEIEFAARYTQAKKICITGSNGKTTTTLLTYHILKKAGYKVGLAGNVGNSFALQVAENDFDYYVLEISSFQLDGMYSFKADIAVLMNITPDHLDRYDNNFMNYADSKFRIVQNQTTADALIYCFDDDVIVTELAKRNVQSKLYPFSIQKSFVGEGAYIKEKELIINIKENITSMRLDELALQGKHNAYNSMAAGIASRLLEIRKETIKQCLSDFQNIEHRLERVANIHGIEFINDSKATNVNSTWYALESMQKPVIWIVGGLDKGNDYSLLKNLVKAKVKAIICLGIDNKKLYSAFADLVPTIEETQDIKEAVNMAYHLGVPDDVVLLSPACASFDLFENYKDRGNQFKTAVQML
ncbi:MAG TPA: UDP-N-acetylmuramoyl-L-alanine--D-glutamate ligase [Bacteroidales bacterium]|nr:UDP-N-acetylmuramoyl-L-alanine--D-glutamate ligase [Bacteroidales bacterium]